MGFIFQKEWLKTKYILIGSFAAILFSFINFIVSIDNGIEFNKPASYINGIVYYEKFSFGSFLLINVIFAGILGLYQFFKERENGRLRIHLHLPYTYFHNINSMVAFGGLSLLVIFTIEFILFWAFASYYFPVEIVSVLSVKLIISFLISFATYFSAPAVMVEPNKIKNIAYGILLAFIIQSLLKINSGFFSHQGMWLFYIWIIVFELSTLYLSFYRYTKGYIK